MIIGASNAVTRQAPEVMAIELLITRRDGSPLGRRQFVGAREVTVGRDASCTVALDDLTVSRRHALLRFERDGVRVEDVSTNGTAVGEQIIRRARCWSATGR